MWAEVMHSFPKITPKKNDSQAIPNILSAPPHHPDTGTRVTVEAMP